MNEDAERILRVPIPLPLIDRMDELISRRAGGFTTRAELIREAVEAMVMELAYPPAPSEPSTRAPSATGTTLRRPGPPTSGDGSSGPTNTEHWGWTALRAPSRGIQIEEGIAEVRLEPLFGVHNRDYPSLWAAVRLGALASAELVPMDDFLEQVIAEAWDYGARLSELDRRFGFKVSALFPTNVSKPQSAAGVFASFAIGDYGRVGSRIVASGPLFLWNICQVQLVGGKPCIGTTGEGYDLLERLDGLTAAIPHDRKYADIFFEYLQKRAPVDWAGFAAVLESVGSGITRPELVQAFETHWPEWTATKASTNTAGYVARAREWGLVGTKQIDRRYVLTEYGETLSEQLRTA